MIVLYGQHSCARAYVGRYFLASLLVLKFLKLQNTALDQLVFFFDFDGSLCLHLEVWQERSYDPQAIWNILDKLNQKAQGVFWNTGRRLESLVSVYEPYKDFSGYFVQGSVYWDAQSQSQNLLGLALPEDLASEYTRMMKEVSHLRLEIKPSSLRIAAYQTASLDEVGEFLERHPLPEKFQKDWVWHLGSRGAELLARGQDKSYAVRDYYSKNPHSKAIPVAVGDDVLDRPAIEEVLNRGGFAILVGEHCGWAADIEHKAWQICYCDHPSDVLSILKSMLSK